MRCTHTFQRCGGRLCLAACRLTACCYTACRYTACRCTACYALLPAASLPVPCCLPRVLAMPHTCCLHCVAPHTHTLYTRTQTNMQDPDADYEGLERAVLAALELWHMLEGRDA